MNTNKMKSLMLLVVIFHMPMLCYAIDYKQSVHLLELLKNEKYSILEKRLHKYVTDFEKDVSLERDLDTALEAFDNSQPWIEEKAKNWIGTRRDSYIPYLIYALHHHRAGWNSRGKKIFDKTTQKQVDLMRRHFNIAKLYFDKVLKKKPDLVHAYSYLINIAMNDSALGDPGIYYKKGLEINPYSHRLHLFYSFSLRPRWGGSIEIMEKFVKFMEQSSSGNKRLNTLKGLVLVEKGDAYLYGKNPGKAVELYKKAESFGDFWYLYLNMGSAYTAIKDYKNAILAYDNVVRIRPMYSSAYVKTAKLYMRQGDIKNSLASITKAITIDPGKINNYMLRSKLHYDARDYKSAIKDMKFAGELSPNNPRIESNIKMLERMM